MNFANLAKRTLLILMVNVLVISMITLVLSLLGAGNYLPKNGMANLAVFCLIWGMVGAFISLALSRLMAKWFMGVRVIPPDTSDPNLRRLVEMVHDLARRADLPAMPEVGIYESPEVNAFATGPTRSRSLVAVSTGLLRQMDSRQVTGVLGHEVAHIANGDMVTMTLVQGVINAFVMFLSRVLAFVIAQALRSRDSEDRGGGFGIQFLLVMVFQTVFGILGFMVVAWFSRLREFRADAGGAAIAGRENMISALQGLQSLYNPQLAKAEAHRAESFQSLKISGAPSGFALLFSTHPPIEKRIARLQQLSS